MSKRKTSLGLADVSNHQETSALSDAVVVQSSEPLEKKEMEEGAYVSKKKIINYKLDDRLHDALVTLIYTRRHEKASFQTLLSEGIELLLKSRGLPSMKEIISGKKTIKP